MNIQDYSNVYVLDCGKNGATISHNGQATTSLTHAQILDLPNKLPKDSLLVCEYAHLGCPREEYSMSQPLEDVELKKLYDSCVNNYITLRLFPQKSMPRASSYSNMIKGDDLDPIAIYNLLKDFPSITLMRPPKSFMATKKIEEMWNHKDITNKILNIARMKPRNGVDGYDVEGKNDDKNTQWIIDNIHYIYENLSTEARDCFGFEFYSETKGSKENRGKLKVKSDKKWHFKMAQIYSILAVLRDHKGNLRKRESTGNFISNNDAKRYIFCMSPFHHRGGVARSNLYYHGAMNWIISKAKYQGVDLKRKITIVDDDGEQRSRRIRRGHFTPEEEAAFLPHRQIYSRACMEIYRLFKTMLDSTTLHIESKPQKQTNEQQMQLDFKVLLVNN